MKVAIIAVVKNENLYIGEWINYHLCMGFDNIIICENNNAPEVYEVINDSRVIIEDFIGIINVQYSAYNSMYCKYRSQYDWILFLDVDEFLVIPGFNSVKDYINSIPSKYNMIRLCWRHYTDNDELDVINGDYSVFSRFKTQIETLVDGYTKFFISTSIEPKRRHILSHYVECLDGYDAIEACDANGDACAKTNKMIQIPTIAKAWINHYRTKTIGEFIRQKWYRGGANSNSGRYRNSKFFFETNTKTPEKIKYGNNLIVSLHSKYSSIPKFKHLILLS